MTGVLARSRIKQAEASIIGSWRMLLYLKAYGRGFDLAAMLN